MDIDLAPADWRALAGFRFTLQAGELPETVDVEVADGEVDEARVRAAFSLPESFDQPALDRAVDIAIDAIRGGDVDRASDAVAGEITTYCEHRAPEQMERHAVEVACHRYDPAVDADPIPWTCEEDPAANR